MALSKGTQAIVCSCHYHLVKKHKWYLSADKYAARTTWNPKRIVYMHRVIANAPPGYSTDHIDGNSLNNICFNLRYIPQKLNVANSGLSSKSTTGYKGVSQLPRSSRFRAYISVKRKQRHLGCFATPEEAALAYNRAAIEQWGEHAWLNQVRKVK